MKIIKNTKAFAYLAGFLDRLECDGVGRTHPTDQDWNESYDKGRNLAERFEHLVGNDSIAEQQVEGKLAIVMTGPDTAYCRCCGRQYTDVDPGEFDNGDTAEDCPSFGNPYWNGPEAK